jgi:hypothetical protein
LILEEFSDNPFLPLFYKNPSRYAFPVIRLAELYLSYAEAMNEYNGPSAEVYTYINLIRTRAGFPDGVIKDWADHSTNATKATTKDGLRGIIQKERLIELAFENHRYWDLRRWKLAKTYMNRPIKGWNIGFKEKEDYYQLIDLHNQKFETRNYLWPIRTYVLSVNSNLVQNPGW